MKARYRLSPETYTKDQFEKLFMVFIQHVVHNNMSHAQELLGISRQTLTKLTHAIENDLPYKLPPGDHWVRTLTYYLQQSIILLNPTHSPRMAYRHQQIQRTLNKLYKTLTTPDGTTQEDAYLTSSTAPHDILALLTAAKNHKMSLDLLSARTGYSKRTIRRHATAMQLIRTTCGFGEDKETFYTLPGA